MSGFKETAVLLLLTTGEFSHGGKLFDAFCQFFNSPSILSVSSQQHVVLHEEDTALWWPDSLATSACCACQHPWEIASNRASKSGVPQNTHTNALTHEYMQLLPLVSSHVGFFDSYSFLDLSIAVLIILSYHACYNIFSYPTSFQAILSG